RLEESFARLSQHYTAIVSFRNKFLASIAWPLFELTFAIFIVGLFIYLCDSLYSSLGMKVIDWFGMGSTLKNVAAYFVLVFMFLSAAALLSVGSVRGWFGTIPLRIAMRIPLIGKTIQYLALSRFAWTLSVAENAGMNAIETAKLALRSTENYYYTSLESVVCHNLQQGHQFYKTFKATDSFPEELITYIENGEISGELAESMNRASAELQAKAEINLKAISVIGFVLTMILVGLLVLTILIFAMQAYINILNNVGNF
ncbi:type II secretion system F family protein, partial [Mariniblastus sp.]|nr:type II secretion system F family protein [Mariniblastus sp.]